jgi:hypothetical protein
MAKPWLGLSSLKRRNVLTRMKTDGIALKCSSVLRMHRTVRAPTQRRVTNFSITKFRLYEILQWITYPWLGLSSELAPPKCLPNKKRTRDNENRNKRMQLRPVSSPWVLLRSASCRRFCCFLTIFTNYKTLTIFIGILWHSKAPSCCSWM